LGSYFAIVNSSGEPLADREASKQIKDLWLAALTKYPGDPKVLEHALNFLRVVDRAKAMEALRPMASWNGYMPWLGNICGLAALGVGASDYKGEAVAAEDSIPATGFGGSVPAIVLNSDQAAFVLSTLWTITKAAHSLAAINRLPAGYDGLCESILKHAKGIYPGTTASCDTRAEADDQNPPPLAVVGGKVAGVKMRKKVPPSYPPEARSQRIQGTLEFSAFIDTAGKIEELDLISGVFALYAAATQAVKQWEYIPLELGGKPVPVQTDITIHFALGQ
jgi:TonB family protein